MKEKIVEMSCAATFAIQKCQFCLLRIFENCLEKVLDGTSLARRTCENYDVSGKSEIA